MQKAGKRFVDRFRDDWNVIDARARPAKRSAAVGVRARTGGVRRVDRRFGAAEFRHRLVLCRQHGASVAPAGAGASRARGVAGARAPAACRIRCRAQCRRNAATGARSAHLAGAALGDVQFDLCLRRGAGARRRRLVRRVRPRLGARALRHRRRCGARHGRRRDDEPRAQRDSRSRARRSQRRSDSRARQQPSHARDFTGPDGDRDRRHRRDARLHVRVRRRGTSAGGTGRARQRAALPRVRRTCRWEFRRTRRIARTA